ncbi:MAG: 2-dehydro-3-deoxygalactonokinase, partial [Deferribacteraceae bacterium]|nr:2-dehydro-3-deoxygalactonokinase [Deferribacteraceae bacterium]
MRYLTIDAGTSNTRATLWDGDRQVLARVKHNVGVRNTAMDKNNSKLKAAVNACIAELTGGQLDDCVILASGMISSGLGLYELPHLSAPAGKAAFAAAIVRADIDGVDTPI